VALQVRDDRVLVERLDAQAQVVQVAALAAGRGAAGLDHLCLRVEPFDQDAIVAHLKRHGVAIGDIRRRYGAEGNGISIYVTDPEGNTVELKGPSDGQPPPA